MLDGHNITQSRAADGRRWRAGLLPVAGAALVAAAAGFLLGRSRGSPRPPATVTLRHWKTRMPSRTRPARLEVIRFDDDGSIPNNPRLPLVHYHGVVGGDDLAATFEEAFARNGWGGAWRDGIYTYHHYHSTAHEVLGIARGRAKVRLGGEGGITVEIRAGDMIVIPAGVGHNNEGASADLLVVGAYPEGQAPDLCTGKPDEHARALETIGSVALPSADPLFGAKGPLVREWSRV